MKHIVSRMSSYFPNRWPLSYLNLTKNMKTYIRRQQHKKFFIHQDIKQKEPPQKYRLGTISNTKLLAGLNRFYSAFCMFSGNWFVLSPELYLYYIWNKVIQTKCWNSDGYQLRPSRSRFIFILLRKRFHGLSYQ